MKTKIIILIAVVASAFAACRKCETCTPYNSKLHIPESMVPSAGEVQTVYVCRQAEIKAYETGKNFIASNGDSVYFMCTDTAI